MSEHPTDLQRMREVYPMGRKPCAWCATKSGRHNFDCPVPDVNALADALARASSLAPVAGAPNLCQPDPGIEQAFKAGYHCSWTGHGYVFDAPFRPGDPDGAFAAWMTARDRVAPPSGVQKLRDPEPGWKAHDFDAEGPDGQCRRCMTLRHEAIRVSGPECERDETYPRLASPLPRSTEGEALTALMTALGFETPWSVTEVLRRLASVAFHAREAHDCDHLGHEGDRYAAVAAQKMADELEALLTARASSPPPPVSPAQEEAIGKAQAIARELRCEVTCKRCLDFGCRHEGALDKDNLDYRCPSCAAYTFLLTTWPPALPETAGTRTDLTEAIQTLIAKWRFKPLCDCGSGQRPNCYFTRGPDNASTRGCDGCCTHDEEGSCRPLYMGKTTEEECADELEAILTELARQASVPPVTTTVFRECYSHGDDAITAPPAADQTPSPDET